jgi:hypothetical protein
MDRFFDSRRLHHFAEKKPFSFRAFIFVPLKITLSKRFPAQNEVYIGNMPY